MPRTLADVPLKAVHFRKAGSHGDFEYMNEDSRYDDTLFLIFENVHDMLYSVEPGGGTAVLRLYCLQHCNDDERPNAVGIPTGWTTSSGFTHMDGQVKAAIDNAFERIHTLLQTYSYDKIIYSCDEHNPKLIGRGIFKDTLCDEVWKYISKKIRRIPKAHKQQVNGHPKLQLKSLKKCHNFETKWLGPTAKAMVYAARLRITMKKKFPQVALRANFDPTHPCADFSNYKRYPRNLLEPFRED